MKLQQLRYLCEIARHGLNFSSAAAALRTSQPAVSKQVRLLEEELGTGLFVRTGNRIVEMTEPGRRIVDIGNLVLRELDNVKSAAREFTEGETGELNLAATFTFARYKLPGVLRRFVARYPGVQVRLLQGTPAQVARFVAAGEADIGLTTPPAGQHASLVFLEYCKLPRALVAPRGHPLLAEKRVTLKSISAYPLITLDVSSRGQSRMRDLFARSGLEPRIVFSGVDVDVVKAFVEAGMGIAVLPGLALEAGRDPLLRAVDVSHLFEPHSGCLALRKLHYLRGYAYGFIGLMSPELDRRAVDKALEAARAGG